MWQNKRLFAECVASPERITMTAIKKLKCYLATQKAIDTTIWVAIVNKHLDEIETENKKLKEDMQEYIYLANILFGFIDITPKHPLHSSIRQDIKSSLARLKRAVK